jgi:uncharacterized membrane protein YphA (DoxX/SURF4 family)
LGLNTRWLAHPVVGSLCRLLLGGAFVYASVPKLLRPDDFARLVAGYRVIHPDLSNFAGIVLPWIEAIAGLCLVVGIAPRSSALVLAGLLGMFIGAGFLALVRGLEISCGCFFPLMGGQELGWDLMVRDVILLLVAAQPVIWPSSFLPRWLLRRSD